MSIELHITRDEIKETLEKLYKIRDTTEVKLEVAREEFIKEKEEMIEKYSKLLEELDLQLEIDSTNYKEVVYEGFKQDFIRDEEVIFREKLKRNFLGWYRTEQKVKQFLGVLERDTFEMTDVVRDWRYKGDAIEHYMKVRIAHPLASLLPAYEGTTLKEVRDLGDTLKEWTDKDIPRITNSRVRNLINHLEELATASGVERMLRISGDTSKNYIKALKEVKQFKEEEI